MRRLTSSITSTNASFLRYFMSARRQERAPVACIVILDESSCVRFSYQYPKAIPSIDVAYHCSLRLDSFCRDVHLECVCLCVLRVSKVKNFWIKLAQRSNSYTDLR